VCRREKDKLERLRWGKILVIRKNHGIGRKVNYRGILLRG